MVSEDTTCCAFVETKKELTDDRNVLVLETEPADSPAGQEVLLANAAGGDDGHGPSELRGHGGEGHKGAAVAGAAAVSKDQIPVHFVRHHGQLVTVAELHNLGQVLEWVHGAGGIGRIVHDHGPHVAISTTVPAQQCGHVVQVHVPLVVGQEAVGLDSGTVRFGNDLVEREAGFRYEQDGIAVEQGGERQFERTGTAAGQNDVVRIERVQRDTGMRRGNRLTGGRRAQGVGVGRGGPVLKGVHGGLYGEWTGRQVSGGGGVTELLLLLLLLLLCVYT
jgi:hypothetical protein